MVASGAHSKEERLKSGVKQESAPASNGELRGGKGSLYEGGVRTPTIVNWPGKLKPRVVNEPLHMVDIMPTLLALAGGKANADQPLDGKDIWATVADGQPSPHEDILINVEAFRGAIIKGKWKLMKIALLPGKTELFDLTADPGENTNVAEQYPDIGQRSGEPIARLRQAAEDQRVDQGPAGLPRRTGARRSSIRTSTSTTAACRTRNRRCRRTKTTRRSTERQKP